jgi:hypothetical protein
MAGKAGMKIIPKRIPVNDKPEFFLDRSSTRRRRKVPVKTAAKRCPIRV